MKASVTIYCDGMGDDATEEDFDAFVSFVSEHIGEAVGFPVHVEGAAWGLAGTTRVSAESTDDAEIVRNAVQDLWILWCAS